jgi:hypothetical protein
LTQPVWVDCASVADVGPPEQLAAQASGGRHVVLRFPSLRPDEVAGLVGRLSTALPECSIFNSSGGLTPAWVTIMPVVTRARVLERRGEVLAAVEEYRRACSRLIEQYEAGTLPANWQADEHGGHCRFKSRATGQVVEAPLEWVGPVPVDPYFFAEFVKTTAGLERVAELIEHNFHDGARILDIVAAEAEPSPAADPARPDVSRDHGSHGGPGR